MNALVFQTAKAARDAAKRLPPERHGTQLLVLEAIPALPAINVALDVFFSASKIKKVAPKSRYEAVIKASEALFKATVGGVHISSDWPSEPHRVHLSKEDGWYYERRSDGTFRSAPAGTKLECELGFLRDEDPTLQEEERRMAGLRELENKLACANTDLKNKEKEMERVTLMLLAFKKEAPRAYEEANRANPQAAKKPKIR